MYPSVVEVTIQQGVPTPLVRVREHEKDLPEDDPDYIIPFSAVAADFRVKPVDRSDVTMASWLPVIATTAWEEQEDGWWLGSISAVEADKLSLSCRPGEDQFFYADVFCTLVEGDPLVPVTIKAKARGLTTNG